MHSFLLLTLVMALAYGAPTDLVTQANEVLHQEVLIKPNEVISQEADDVLKAEPTSIEGKASISIHTDDKPLVPLTPLEPLEPLEPLSPLPPVIEVVEETHSEEGIDKQLVLNAGKHLSEAITAKIVGPVVIFNSKVAAAAGALPPLLAAKGAVIGSAIATPIEVGAVAGSSIVSGVTGKLVALPISVATGTIAKVIGAAEKGRQIWNFNLEHGGEIFKDGIIRMGHVILKPIAVVWGAQTALTGAGIGIAGAGIKGVGVGIGTVGAKMIATGVGAKALGTTLIKSQFV